MRPHYRLALSLVVTLLGAPTARADAGRGEPEPVLTGQQAYGDWRDDAPGRRRLLTPQDMPAPFASASASNTPSVVAPAGGLLPKVPVGYTVQRFAALDSPRLVRVAPNGDIFVAETSVGKIRVLRAADGAARPDRDELFADGLAGPFGIAFYPSGANPQWVYVATVNSVVRYPYRPGDLKPAGAPQTVVAALAASIGYHTTRDIQFSPDGRRMFVSVGSGSNVAAEMERRTPDEIRQWEARTAPGAAWGHEAGRADVLAFDPDGTNRRVFATGLRNCVGLAVHPATGDLWCSTNERDGMGDDLAAGLRHAGAGGRFLRLALVLHRRQRGPAPAGRAARPARPRDGAGRADPAAFGAAGDDLLSRRRPAPPPRSRRPRRRRLRGAARLVEPRAAHRLQGRPHPAARRRAERASTRTS